MKRIAAVLLVLVILLTAVVCVSAGAETVEQEKAVAEVYGEESAGEYSGADIFSHIPGAVEKDSPSRAVMQDKPDLAATGAKSVTDYTYEITPLLAPFNTFFFVKTDNPDPTSFRFVDSESVYFEKENETDYLGAYMNYSDELVIFADVKYEDKSTGRVAGGYIFKCKHFNTDGGKLTLQYKTGYHWWDEKWIDTKITCTIPKLKDNVDYLIDTYANKGSFFADMDAVQDGFDSICFYSGSYVRGKIERMDPYWILATAGHSDQSFYIYSPFDRKDSESLFASAIYPFRYDSIGFPSVMAEVSKRLSSESTYEWGSNHWLINVTYNGATKSYGGAGRIEGKGIDREDIIKTYTLAKSDGAVTLENTAELLKKYAALTIEDDIPRDDALTFEFISDTVGKGAWVRLSGSNMSSGGHHDLSNPVFTYLYTKDGVNYIRDDEWGVGYRNYHGGKLGYFSDTWVDGRYISNYKELEKGAKFEDHPNSNIFLTNREIPLISCTTEYRYNKEKKTYEIHRRLSDIKMKNVDVLYRYDSADDKWYAATENIASGYAKIDVIKELVESGDLDSSYLDKLTLTRDQAVAMKLDKNTDTDPGAGYIFDGTAVPGTPFGFAYILGDVDTNGEIEAIDASYIQRVAALADTPLTGDEVLHGDVDRNGKTDITDATAIQYYLADLKTRYKIGEMTKVN